MDALTIAAYAVQALELVPRVIAVGDDIGEYVSKTTGVLKTAQESKTEIPAAAWDDLKAIREGLQARLHAK